MAAGKLRLLHLVGAQSYPPDVRSGRRSALPATRILGLRDRLPTLGRAAQPAVPISETVVCHAQLRYFRPAEVHTAPHPLGENVRRSSQKG